MSSISSTSESNSPAHMPQAGMTRAMMLLAGLLVIALGVGVATLLSLRFGSLEITTSQAWNAVFSFNSEVYEQVVVRELRVPRTIIALAVGGSLGIAGTVMQGVTRNPLRRGLATSTDGLR